MKTIIAFISLAVGLVIGFYAGYRYYERQITNEAVQQMLDGMESSDRLQTLYAVRAISMIESGQPEKAAQSLSRPIVDYYFVHANLAHNDKRTTDLLAMIDLLATTNQLIAYEMTNEIHGKIK